MHLVLGIIIGLLIAIIIQLTVKRYQKPIERTIKQVENRFKEQGEVYYEDEARQDLDAFLENLPKE